MDLSLIPPSPARARRRRGLGGLAAASLVAALVAVPTSTAAAHTSDGDATVVSDWNAIAISTFLADPTKAPVESILYMGFVQAAVYDAVVGIDGRYEPYRFPIRAPRGASAQAAAAAAAHRILVTYSPYATAALDADLATSLMAVPDGPDKAQGVAFGELAAARIIQLRTGDGRNASITFTQPPGPGVWRPTPPALLPMSAPWLGFVRPLLVPSVNPYEPGPPPALTSARYTTEFAEVKALGSAASILRTADQTATAMFFSGLAPVQYNAALRDQVAVRHLDIVDAAHLLAAVDMTAADTIIGVWRAKYVYGFWRPITAIQLADTDGNPATAADPTWAPLITTPNYPEYVSGYSGYTGAFTTALAGALDTRHLHVTLISTAVPGAQRSYDSGSALDRDVIDARVWLGIHIRTSDVRGVRLGQQIADWALDHYFRPAHFQDR